MDTTVSYEGSAFSIGGVLDIYATSDLGKYHADQDVRFHGWYGYDQATMLADLGDDVHPVRHMAHTESLLTYVIAGQNTFGADVEQFSPEDALVGRTAAALHDIGENTHPDIKRDLGVEVGDVPKEIHTAEHERDEASIRSYLYSRLFGSLPPRLITATEAVIAGEDASSLPTRAFQSVEQLGYFLTAIRAGNVALGIMDLDPKAMETRRFEQLTRLARRVTTNWFEKLVVAGETLPAIGQTVRAHQAKNDEIHDRLPSIFSE